MRAKIVELRHSSILCAGGHEHMSAKILADFKFGGARAHRQTAKFNSPPNVVAIRYYNDELLIFILCMYTPRAASQGLDEEKKPRMLACSKRLLLAWPACHLVVTRVYEVVAERASPACCSPDPARHSPCLY